MVGLKTKRFIDYYVGNLILSFMYVFVRFFSKISRRDHSLKESNSICFIKMLGGGNLFALYPALYELKKKKHQKFYIVCSTSLVGFAKAMGVFEEIWVISDNSFFEMIKSFFKVCWKMNRKVDTIIDLEVHSRATSILAVASACRNRIGLLDSQSMWRRKIYSHGIYHNPSKARYVPYDSIAPMFGVKKINIEESRGVFAHFLENQEKTQLLQRIQSERFVVLAVGCSDLSHERKLPIERWRFIVENLLNYSDKIVFLGDKKDSLVVEEILETIGYSEKIINLCGKCSLIGSLQVLSKSQAFLGVDSALIHFSRFLNIPTVGFWGPTEPESLLRPLKLKELHLFEAVPCSPCVHFSLSSPCGGQNLCMEHSNEKILKALFFIKSENTFEMKKNIFQHSWIYYPNEVKPRSCYVEINMA